MGARGVQSRRLGPDEGLIGSRCKRRRGAVLHDALAGMVQLLGHSTGGRPSERLLRRLGMPVSDTTILASLKEQASARSGSSAVHVAGIDDWAWRKGSNYGTIVVDLERREVVDVLADRSAATAANWFKIPWGGG